MCIVKVPTIILGNDCFNGNHNIHVPRLGLVLDVGFVILVSPRSMLLLFVESFPCNCNTLFPSPTCAHAIWHRALVDPPSSPGSFRLPQVSKFVVPIVTETHATSLLDMVYYPPKIDGFMQLFLVDLPSSYNPKLSSEVLSLDLTKLLQPLPLLEVVLVHMAITM